MLQTRTSSFSFPSSYLLKLYFFMSVCLLSVSFKAQDNIIDSLKLELKNAKHDTVRVKVLSRLTEVLDATDCQQYHKEMRLIVDKQLKLHPHDKFYLYHFTTVLLFRGFLDLQQGNTSEALNCFYKGLKTSEETEDKNGKANILNAIAQVYDIQGEKFRALAYYEKSLRLAKLSKSSILEAQVLNNIGNIYLQKNQLQEALENYTEALKIAQEINSKHLIGSLLTQLGKIYYIEKQPAKALEQYEKSLIIFEEINDDASAAISLFRIASMKLDENKTSEALISARKCYAISEELGFPYHIQNSALLLKRIYLKQHKYQEAFSMYELEIQMRDSINNDNTRKAAVEKELEYEYGKKEVELKAKAKIEKEKILLKAAEEKHRQNLIMYSALLVLVLVVVFSVFIFRSLQKNKEANRIITQKNKEVEKQNELINEQRHVLSEKNKEINDSVNYALGIQQALLATEKHIQNYVPDSFVLFKPKDIVSGDFYWFDAKDDLLLFAVADCTGHGVPGSMMSMIAINLLRLIVNEKNISSPQQVLTVLDQKLTEMLHAQGHINMVNDGMDIAFVEYNLQTKLLRYSGANRPLWILKGVVGNGNEQFLEIKPSKHAIGGLVSEKTFEQYELQLEKGDSIYLTTDGYADQFGGDRGKKMMTKTLKDQLTQSYQYTMQEQKNHLELFFNNWKHAHEQIDDVTVMGVRV